MPGPRITLYNPTSELRARANKHEAADDIVGSRQRVALADTVAAQERRIFIEQVVHAGDEVNILHRAEVLQVVGQADVLIVIAGDFIARLYLAAVEVLHAFDVTGIPVEGRRPQRVLERGQTLPVRVDGFVLILEEADEAADRAIRVARCVLVLLSD